jgi:hypothetical protein
VEILIFFMPVALAVIPTGTYSYFVGKGLLRLVRQRYPSALDAARGRERRWYDASEELLLGEKRFRRGLLEALKAPADSDAELARVLRRLHAADRLFWRAAIVSAGVSVVLFLAFRFLVVD